MRTGELQKLTGVSTVRLQRLIDAGLVGRAEHHTGSGFKREFTPAEVEHIQFTLALIDAGMKPVRAALAAAEVQADGCAKVGPFHLVPRGEVAAAEVTGG